MKKSEALTALKKLNEETLKDYKSTNTRTKEASARRFATHIASKLTAGHICGDNCRFRKADYCLLHEDYLKVSVNGGYCKTALCADISLFWRGE